VLQRVRANFDRNRLLVVILTAADELPTIRRAYALGADSFIVKPPRPEDLLNLARGFCFHWGTVGDLIGHQTEARAVSGTK
jgi:two-component system, response regulator